MRATTLLALIFAFSTCIESSGSRQPWRLPVGHSLLYPLPLDAGRILLCIRRDRRHLLAAVTITNGTIDWSWPPPVDTLPALYYNARVVEVGNTVYVPDGTTLHGIDGTYGHTVFTHTASTPGSPYLQPTTDGQVWRAYGGPIPYTLTYASDGSAPDTVMTLRSASFPGTPGTAYLLRTPLPTPDSGYVAAVTEYAPLEHTRAYLLSHTGDALSAYPGNNKGYGITKPPLRLHDNNLVWVAFDQVFSTDPTGMKLRWRRILPRDMLTSLPTADSHTLYLALEDEFLYALDLQDGTTRWRAPTAGTPSRVILHDGSTWLIGGSNGRLYRFDVESGKPLPLPTNLPPPPYARSFGIVEGYLILCDYRYWYGVPLSQH